MTVLRPNPNIETWFAYVPDIGSNKVSGHIVNSKCQWGDIHHPHPIPGQPFSTGNGPTRLAADPTETFAYVVKEGDNDIWEYKISGNGSLTSLGSPVPTGVAPVEIVIH